MDHAHTGTQEQQLRGAASSEAADPGRAGLWILAATILGSSMVFIDGAVVNVALAIMQADLNATVTDLQWIVESYALFLSALILLGGSLGDLYGRRRMFAYGTVVFAAASVWCGLSPNATQLIIARAVQGVGGALLTPGSLALISASFGEAERGRAIGTWSGATAITTAGGPVLGGWLAENASWRWVFFINVPLAVLVLAITYTRVPESRGKAAEVRLDPWGALLATLGLGAVVYGLIESVNLGLRHPVVLGALTGGTLALVAFVWVESRVRSPMMPLYLFRSRTFSGANLLTLLLYAALGASFFFLPYNLIQVQAYSATAAGAAALPSILIMSALSRWTGGLIDRFGAKLPLIVGPLIAGAGFALYARPGIGGGYWTTFFPAVIVMGLGLAITVAPLTTAVMGAVGTSHSGVASGVNNAVARTAGLLAIATMGILVLSVFNASLDKRLETLDVPAQTQQALEGERSKLAGAEPPGDVTGEARRALEDAVDESFVSSFRVVMLLCAGLAVASALVAFLFVEGKVSDLNPVEPQGAGG